MSARLIRWTVCSAFLVLSACGGGGGGANPQPLAQLTVTPKTVSITAGTTDSAPSATIQASISNPNGNTYFFSSASGTSGIASVSNPASGTTGNFTVQFKAPSSLGVGTYVDTVTVKACSDSGCQEQISGSPVAVQVTYVVAVLPQISSLGPNTVAAGGGPFQIVITGSNFDSTSVAQVDGNARSTFFASATSLIATLTSADIANAGNIQITVANYESTGTTVSSPATLVVSAGTVTPAVLIPDFTIAATWDTSLGGAPTIQQAFTVSVNGPTGATYYYVMSYTGSAVASLGVNGTLTTGTTTPTGSPTGRITGEPNGGLGGTVSGSFTGATLANISVGLVNAAQMGAGIYSDAITIIVCTDAQCAHPIGSPQSVGVNYVVTGNPIPDTQFQIQGVSLTLEAATSATTPPSTTATVSSNGLPPYGAYVFTSVLSGSLIAATNFQSNLDGEGTLTVTAKPAPSLGSGIYTASIQVQICYDSACTKPANHFPQVVQVTYIVVASAGVDFTQRSVSGEVWDLAYSTVNDRIYATANSDTGGLQHSMVVINPNTAAVEQIVSLGAQSAPTGISLSDDGQFAYILDEVASSAVRVQLSTLTIDETVPLTLIGGALKVAPGQPATFAVETDDANLLTMRVFDGTVQRSQTFNSGQIEIPLSFTWGADATTMFAYSANVQSPTLYQLSVSSNGLASSQPVSLAFHDTNIDDIQYVGGLIYTSGGSIYNLSSGSIQTFPLQNTNAASNSVSATMTIDSTSVRAYALTNDTTFEASSGQTIEGFNLSTLQPTWITRVPSVHSKLIRWGSNGLAYFDGNVLNPSVILISGSVVTR